MEDDEVIDLNFRFVLVVRFEERLDRADYPPTGVYEIAQVLCKGTQVSVREGGGVPVALLLLDGERFEVPRLRGLKVSFLSRDTCQLVVGNRNANAVTVLLRDREGLEEPLPSRAKVSLPPSDYAELMIGPGLVATAVSDRCGLDVPLLRHRKLRRAACHTSRLSRAI
jgi:hypothetical protein